MSTRVKERGRVNKKNIVISARTGSSQQSETIIIVLLVDCSNYIVYFDPILTLFLFHPRGVVVDDTLYPVDGCTLLSYASVTDVPPVEDCAVELVIFLILMSSSSTNMTA